MNEDKMKALYESIMSSVAKQVKIVLNENVPFKQDGHNYLICNRVEEKAVNKIVNNIISNYVDSVNMDDYEDGDTIEFDTGDYEPEDWDVTEEDLTLKLNGITGTLSFSADIELEFRSYADDDYVYGSYYVNEFDGYTIHNLIISFFDNEDNIGYHVYRNMDEYKKANRKKFNQIEDTEVVRNYKAKRKAEQEAEWKRRAEEQKKKDREYEEAVKANPEKYIKAAESMVADAVNNYLDWAEAADAERIYQILGMKEEARQAHSVATFGYHREEAAAGLL